MSTILRPAATDEDTLYPYCDGEPMAESDLHAEEMMYAFSSVQWWLQNRPDAYVSLDTFLYYKEGDSSSVVSPDLYVVFGSTKAPRKSYKVWQEGGRLPSFVLEITSRSTRQTDMAPRPNGIPRPRVRRRAAIKNKYLIYEQVLGIAEYFLFDPTGDYLNPRLQGFRLIEGRYTPIEAEPTPLPNLPAERQPVRWLYSAQLGLAFGHEDRYLRCYDPANGTLLLRAVEALNALEAQTERAAAEAQARAETEAKLARLRAELEALRNRPSA